VRSPAFTLVEAVVTVALVVLLMTAAATLALGSRPFALRDAEDRVAAMLDAGRALAAESGDGATLVFAPGPSGAGTALALYRHRPRPGVALEPAGVERYATAVRVSLEAPAVSAPFAIFVDTGGSVSAAAWSPDAGPLSSEPPCNGALRFAFADGSRVERRSVPCAEATLR